MRALRHDLPNIEVAVSSDQSPDLAAAVASGRIDVAFLRAEPGFDLAYRVVRREPLVVVMPANHRLVARRTIRPKDLANQPFIEMGTKASLLRIAVNRDLVDAGVTMTPGQCVDNPAMVMSLVASTGGVTIIPAYVENLMPSSVVARPLAGAAPTIDLVVGFSRSNASPILDRFLSRLDALIADVDAAGSA